MSTSLNIRSNKGIDCEIDFLMLNLGPKFGEQKIEIAIGECKDIGGEIDDKDISNLKRIKEMIEQSGITCYLVLSKTADSFSAAEISRFKKLVSEGVKIILFTNSELEPYEPYYKHAKKDSLPSRYAHNFRELAMNSRYIYLSK